MVCNVYCLVLSLCCNDVLVAKHVEKRSNSGRNKVSERCSLQVMKIIVHKLPCKVLVTSAKEVMFLPVFVCLFFCVLAR